MHARVGRRLRHLRDPLSERKGRGMTRYESSTIRDEEKNQRTYTLVKEENHRDEMNSQNEHSRNHEDEMNSRNEDSRK